MHHHRFGDRGSGSGTPGRALGSHALALHQQHGLVVFAGQDGAVAFDEHDGWSIRVKRIGRQINIALLETTLLLHKTPAGVMHLIRKPYSDGGRSVRNTAGKAWSVERGA